MTKNQENHGAWAVEDDENPLKHPNFPAFPDYSPDNVPFHHVVPINDLFPHVLSHTDCWCHPALDEEDQSVVVHHSADGREDYETGRRKPN